jgi:hypothetical protein
MIEQLKPLLTLTNLAETLSLPLPFARQKTLRTDLMRHMGLDVSSRSSTVPCFLGHLRANEISDISETRVAKSTNPKVRNIVSEIFLSKDSQNTHFNT